jgi:hypothetical protein
MLDAALLAFSIYASAAPKVAYKPNPAAASDVATVELETPRRSCFGVTRASVLLSSRKADRSRVYVIAVTVADTRRRKRSPARPSAGRP